MRGDGGGITDLVAAVTPESQKALGYDPIGPLDWMPIAGIPCDCSGRERYSGVHQFPLQDLNKTPRCRYSDGPADKRATAWRLLRTLDGQTMQTGQRSEGRTRPIGYHRT